MGLSDSDVARILKLIDESPFDEVRVEFADLKIHVRRGPLAAEASAQPVAGVPAAPAPAATPPIAERGPALAPVPDGCVMVRSPMVGTVYRAASPGAAPFVEIGDRVEEEDPVCMVEVMKLFNSVKAGARGTVRDILVADGGMVEYGQPLMVIELSH